MSEAIFGLIGVAVGALVTGVFEYTLQKRREDQADRVARRMLLLELREARDFIETSIDEGRWTDEPNRILSNEQWTEHRGTWGRSADDKLWRLVALAFIKIAEVRRLNREAPAGTRLDPGDKRTDDAQARLRAIEQAIASLAHV